MKLTRSFILSMVLFLSTPPFYLAASLLGPPDTEIMNGDTVSDINGKQKEWIYYRVVLTRPSRDFIAQLSQGKGDADLYVKYGNRPTVTDYDFRHAEKGNNEIVKIPEVEMGELFIGIYGYYSFSGLSLSVIFNDSGKPTPDLLANGQTEKGLCASKGQMIYRKFIIPKGGNHLVVRIIGGLGDANLYFRYNDNPTESLNDAYSLNKGNNDIIKIKTPEPGNAVIGICAHRSFSGVNLTSSVIDNPPFGVSLETAKAMLDSEKNNPDFMILDIRRFAEHEDIRIDAKCIHHLDYYAYDFHEKLAKLDKSKKYLVHCKTENRSSQVAYMMSLDGFTDFQFMYGGIIGWKEKGYPIVEAVPPSP